MYKMVIKQKDEKLKSGGDSLADSMKELMDQKKVDDLTILLTPFQKL